MNQIASSLSNILDADDTTYEGDLVLWFERQAAFLRARQFEQIDLEHLVEELEAMASRDRRELASRLNVLLTHLLKCQYQPDQVTGSWRGTIRTQRQEIQSLLEQSPSLRRFVAAYVEKGFEHAAAVAADETGLARATFPMSNPYPVEHILDPNFTP